MPRHSHDVFDVRDLNLSNTSVRGKYGSSVGKGLPHTVLQSRGMNLGKGPLPFKVPMFAKF